MSIFAGDWMQQDRHLHGRISFPEGLNLKAGDAGGTTHVDDASPLLGEHGPTGHCLRHQVLTL
jgi:hypothetical protein